MTAQTLYLAAAFCAFGLLGAFVAHGQVQARSLAGQRVSPRKRT